ncbi:MAG: pyruvate formate-lyase-activating protein [bacterium]
MKTSRIHSIETLGGVDGPGMRCVIFFQGCPLRCLYCQNPDTQSFEGGQAMSIAELMRTIERTRPYFGSKGGVTFSGGEPLAQPDVITELLKACHAKEIHTAIDTSGACATRPALEAARLADLLLLDIKHPDPDKCRALTGRGLDGPLLLLQAAEQQQQAVWIRHVVVPGWSNTLEVMEALAHLLAPFTCIQRVELLPYHTMAAEKYRALGRELPLPEIPAITPAQIQHLEQHLKSLWFSRPCLSKRQ